MPFYRRAGKYVARNYPAVARGAVRRYKVYTPAVKAF